jgi:hypothetical protein
MFGASAKRSLRKGRFSRFEPPPEQATYRLSPTLCLDRNSSGSCLDHSQDTNQPYTVVQAPALREGVHIRTRGTFVSTSITAQSKPSGGLQQLSIRNRHLGGNVGDWPTLSRGPQHTFVMPFREHVVKR